MSLTSALVLALAAGLAAHRSPAAPAPAPEQQLEQAPKQEPTPTPALTDGVPFLELSLADAVSRAENNRKLLVIFWTSPSFPDCQRMRESSFRDRDLVAWAAANALAVEVDAATDASLAAKYRVRSFPCVDLYDPVLGLAAERIEGYASADDMLASFSGSLLGGGPVPKPEGDRIEDPYAWLAYGNWKARGTDLDANEAARAYAWVLQNADQYRPGFRARYFEFLLRRLAYLKPRSREALSVMERERDRLEGRIANGAPEPRAVHDLVRIDWWTRRTHKTRETFTALAGRGEAAEAARALLFRHVIEELGRNQDFGPLLGGLGERSAVEYTRARFAVIDANLARQAAGEAVPEYELDSRADAIVAATWLYEALLAAGRGKDAGDLVDLFAEEAPTGRAFSLLVERAQRQGLDKLALEVGQRGLTLLAGQPGERQLRRVMARVPGYVEDGK